MHFLVIFLGFGHTNYGAAAASVQRISERNKQKDDDMIILNTFAIHFVSHFAVYEASEAPTCENNGKMMNFGSEKWDFFRVF